jgi:regulation of enolase protein 1 (concanavalin A-like superfamily)
VSTRLAAEERDMGIALDLSSLALDSVVEAACQVVGARAGEQLANGVVRLLAKQFTDQSTRWTRALARVNERAWRALEIALAGDSFWDRCKISLASGDEKAFRGQVLGFLDALPAGSLPADRDVFRRECWQELRRARKAGALSGAVAPDKLAQRAGTFVRYREPHLQVRAQQQMAAHMAQTLRDAGYPNLAQLLTLGDGPSLLVVAARYFLRRAIEEDAQLFQGLSFSQMEQVQSSQEQGFATLARLFHEQGDRLGALLDDVAETVEQTHSAVLDVRQELQRQGEQNRDLYQAVLNLQARFDLLHRDLRPRDSLSIRDEAERKMVREVIARYRSLPEQQRRGQPALLNAIGQLEVAAGSFEAAGRDFAELAEMALDAPSRAAAHANAYRAALEQRNWPVAQHELLKAIELDRARFAPFPTEKYRLMHILGAGGCGVAFLCEDLARQDKVVVKTLLDDGLDCGLDQLFSEAEVLSKLDHPGVVRLRAHGYTDPAARSRPYLVMEHFEGMTLEAYIQEQGPLSFGELLLVARQMAEALRAAHMQQILHRDVKLANVLVRSGPNGLRIQLIDFGLALRQDTLRGGTRSSNTLVGASIAGTLDYSAPEQLGRLPGVKPGRYSDVYGFGRTCCHALFQTPQPGLKDWQSVPTSLAELLGRCVGQTPQERPADFAEVLSGLDRVQWDLRAQAIISRVEAAPVVEPAVRPAAPRPAPRPARPRPRPPEPDEQEEEQGAGWDFPELLQCVPVWLWAVLGGGAVILLVGFLGLIGLLTDRPSPAEGQFEVRSPPPPQPPAPRLVRPAVIDPDQRRVYLSDLPEFDVGSFPPAWSFGKNGKLGDPWSGKISVDQRLFPKALGMHPPEHFFSSVKYRIHPADTFQALVGMDDSAEVNLPGEFAFEVLGDGATLWKWKTERRRGPVRDCRLSVKSVQVLELRVHAPPTGIQGGHAVWLDPYITRPEETLPPRPAEKAPAIAEKAPTQDSNPVRPATEKNAEKVYLSDLLEKDPGPFPSTLWHFGKNGDAGDSSKVKVNGKEWSKALGMHPPGDDKPCKVRYKLDDPATSLETTVAISEGPWSPMSDVVFEVLGDGQPLWKSGPINRGRTEACKVSLKGVRVLELRTRCGAPTGCHAVWLDPFIVRSHERWPATAAEPAPAADKELAQWGTAIDPEKDCEFCAEATTLTLKVPGSLHDLNHDGAKLNAPRLVRDIEGNFVATVKVGGDFQPGGQSTNPRGVPYNGGGILLWNDAENFIRLERGAMLRGGRVNPIVALEERRRGQRGFVYSDSFAAGAVFLRLERKGRRLFGSVSTDGKRWIPLTPLSTDWPAKLKIGLLAINSSSEPFTARFEDFVLKGQKIGASATSAAERPAPR